MSLSLSLSLSLSFVSLALCLSLSLSLSLCLTTAPMGSFQSSFVSSSTRALLADTLRKTSQTHRFLHAGVVMLLEAPFGMFRTHEAGVRGLPDFWDASNEDGSSSGHGETFMQ